MNLLIKTLTALRAGRGTLMPTCRQVARIQCDALDRPLPTAKWAGLWFHLLICKWCRRYGSQIRFLSRAAHDHPDELAQFIPEKLSDQARERIKRSLQAQGE